MLTTSALKKSERLLRQQLKKTNGTYEIINIKYVQAKPAAYAPVFIFLSYK
jgi:hypothetical protein